MRNHHVLPLIIINIVFLASCANPKKEWDKANKENTIAAYKAFVQLYPDSEYSGLAKNKIIQLTPIKMDCMIEGIWQCGGDKTFDIYYVITLGPEVNYGNINAESKGRIVSSHKFKIVDSATVNIENGTAGCYDGEAMDGNGWNRLFQLHNPPKELQFIKPISKDLIHISGIICDAGKTVDIPLVRINETTRLLLPFNIKIDWHVTVPNNVELIMQDGPWPQVLYNAKYKTPVHPTGYAKALTIEGQPISIANGEIKEGILHTDDYGDIEFLMTSSSSSEVWATRAQIKAIAKMIEENNERLQNKESRK